MKGSNIKTIISRIIVMVCGLLLAALILEIGLRASGFMMLSSQEHVNLGFIKNKSACRIMCLGESTTQDQYPSYLQEILTRSNIGIEFSVLDEGLTCTTTTAILLKLEDNLDKYQPDIVVTMMGCNDRGIRYYWDIPESDTWLFKHCRVYRFSRIVYMNILKKLKKEDVYIAKKPLPNQSKSFEAEKSSEKITEFNPDNDSAYADLGRFYNNQGRFAESEQALKKAIRLNPESDSAYAELGRLYNNQRRSAESEQALKDSIRLNPENDSVYEVLSWVYRDQGKFIEAERMLNKAIELNPKYYLAYVGLGQIYKEQKKLAEAEQVLKKAIELDPQNEIAHGGLATIYCEIGKKELSREYADKLSALREKYYNNPITINNYRKLKEILDKRKIKLVCVQYPMRSIQPLKKIFQDDENIIFVDNEKVFKDGVRKEGYNEYFRDMFGGDFGHCTKQGNRLLAGNIANSILKEIFDK